MYMDKKTIPDSQCPLNQCRYCYNFEINIQRHECKEWENDIFVMLCISTAAADLGYDPGGLSHRLKDRSTHLARGNHSSCHCIEKPGLTSQVKYHL